MPSIAVKRLYEAIYIIKPDATEEQINTTLQKYRGIVEANGGVVEKSGIWERRKLAYEIKGYTEGIYAILHFTGEAKVEAELRRIFQISSGEDQIRYMIVKPEDNDQPASGRPVAEVKAPEATATAEPVAAAEEPAAAEAPAAEVSETPEAATETEAAPAE